MSVYHGAWFSSLSWNTLRSAGALDINTPKDNVQYAQVYAQEYNTIHSSFIYAKAFLKL